MLASIEIPPERIPPIAKEVASNKQTAAALFWFGALLGTVVAFSMDRAQDGAGVAFWVMVLFALGLRQFRIGRRASAAVARAADPSSTWVLAGRELVAYATTGMPVPDASFKLSRSHVTMLTALPKAELRP